MNAIILAGGQNRRIGLKKAFLKIDGEKIIERMIEILKPNFPQIVIVAKDKSEFVDIDSIKITTDLFEGHSSLIGIYSGLLHSEARHNFFFACDMPFLNRGLIEHMIGLCDGYDVVIPRFQGKYEALHAIYSKNCLKAFGKNLKKGDFKIVNAFKGLRVREVSDEEISRFDPKWLSFFNINTQEDYIRAQRLLEKCHCEAARGGKATKQSSKRLLPPRSARGRNDDKGKLVKREVCRYENGKGSFQEAHIAHEKTISIYLNKYEVAHLKATPADKEALAIGYLFTEGFIEKPSDLFSIGDVLDGRVVVNAKEPKDIAQRLFAKRARISGCGESYTYTGTFSKPIPDVSPNSISDPSPFYGDRSKLKNGDGSEIRNENVPILARMHELDERCENYRKSHGLHSAALADKNKILIFMEDIGRHNAVDKVIGQALLDKINLSKGFLITTGRITSEIVKKCFRTGIPLIASRSVPSTEAIELAEGTGIALVGLARGTSFNIYTKIENRKKKWVSLENSSP